MRVISRYAAAVAARVFKHETLEEMARHGSIPVINALSDRHHPLQALADALTLWERSGRIHSVKVAFVGDVANNVATSLAIIGAKLGWEVRLVGPKQLWSMKLIDELSEDLAKTGARIYFTDSINEAAGVDGLREGGRGEAAAPIAVSSKQPGDGGRGERPCFSTACRHTEERRSPTT
jgi:ornithine carbamoyltransferase